MQYLLHKSTPNIAIGIGNILVQKIPPNIQVMQNEVFL